MGWYLLAAQTYAGIFSGGGKQKVVPFTVAVKTKQHLLVTRLVYFFNLCAHKHSQLLCQSRAKHTVYCQSYTRSLKLVIVVGKYLYFGKAFL